MEPLEVHKQKDAAKHSHQNELHKMVTMKPARMAGRNNGTSSQKNTTDGDSTSLLKTPRNSQPEILQNVMVLKCFEEKRQCTYKRTLNAFS
jgi:hypothetical protein